MGNRFDDRKDELRAFKQNIDIAVVASEYGFVVDKKETSRHVTMMRRGDDKIGISRKAGMYMFASNRDESLNGTIIDFAEHYIEPGASLGRIRQILRPYMNSSHMSTLRSQYAGKFVSIENNAAPEVDYLGISARVSQFKKIEGHNSYLCDERAIPAQVLEHPRVRGRVLLSEKHGSIIFPHYGSTDTNPRTPDRCLNGYEIKGPGVNFFSKNGRKGLWASAGQNGDRILAIAESGLDALSYLAMNDMEATRIVSIGGQLNSFQPELLKSAIGRMEEGAVVVSCVDNDPGGDKLNTQIARIVSEVDKAVEFKEHRPSHPGQDWNDVLRAHRQHQVSHSRKLSF